MTWRVLGVLLALVLVGGGVGFAASTILEGSPASGGTPGPIPADGPGTPRDPVVRVLPDPDTPALEPSLPSRPAVVGLRPTRLVVPVPKGWERNDLAGNETVWVAAGSPLNTYNLRVEIVVSQHETISATKAARIAALDSATEQFTVESRTDDAMVATYVYADHRRLTYHRWITFDDPDPGHGDGSTYAEISATGRMRDREGLADLISRVAAGATR